MSVWATDCYMAHIARAETKLAPTPHQDIQRVFYHNLPSDMSHNVFKWYLGTEYTAGYKDNYFRGRLADFAVVNQQLTASQVRQDWNEGHSLQALRP